MNQTLPFHDNMKKNLLATRRRLKMSQQEFIDMFLLDGDDSALSVAKLSNLENKGGRNLDLVCARLASKLSLTLQDFMLEPGPFLEVLESNLSEMDTTKNRKLMRMLRNADRHSQLVIFVHVLSNFITDSMLSGELKRGDKIPSDRNLAELFQVGRNMVREALNVLSVLGMLEVIPGKGTFVASGSSEFFMAPITWAFYMSDKSIDDLVYILRLLEVASIGMAVKKATDKDIEHLEKILAKANNALMNGDYSSFLDLDIEFHLAIASCSHNDVMLNLLNIIRKLARTISQKATTDFEQVKAAFEEHDALLNAMIARDSEEAERLMIMHLDNLAKRYSYNKPPNSLALN